MITWTERQRLASQVMLANMKKRKKKKKKATKTRVLQMLSAVPSYQPQLLRPTTTPRTHINGHHPLCQLLDQNEKKKEEAYAALERTRAQTDRYVDRFGRDPEFVRDQARERMGVAEPGEIVIRVDGARNMATPAKPATPPPAQASR